MIHSDCQILNLPKIADGRGNLSIIEEYKQIPFKIKRSYWIYDVPGGVERGGHAYKENMEFVVALSGSFDIEINNGTETKSYHLNRSYMGLLIPNGIWRVMKNFSTNSLALILSNTEYDGSDYIMDYEEYKKWVASK